MVSNRPMEHADPRPIFVVGYMHSGTTLLQGMLRRHRDVYASKGEARFFELLPALRAEYEDLTDPATRRAFIAFVIGSIVAGPKVARDARAAAQVPEVGEAEVAGHLTACAGATDHVAIFRAVFDRLMALAGKSRWLEKTPTHVFHIDAILAAIPGARIVEITRDVRDILASKKTRRETVWTSDRYSAEQREEKHLEKAFDALWDTLSWKSALAAGRAGLRAHPERVLRVAYEQLVAHPEPVLRDICRFLDLPFDDAMLAVSVDTGAAWAERKQRTGVYRDSVGRWQAVLAPGELAMCQALARAELIELAHPIAPVSLQARLGALALLPHSQRELFDRLARRWRMGGFTFVHRVVRGYAARLTTLARS